MNPELLFQQVYDELRRLAAEKLARESSGHTLEATALVHEVWMRLGDASVDWKDRTHFLRVAANAMRRVLVDHARSRRCAKRGGYWIRSAPIDFAAPLPDSNLPALAEALENLASVKPHLFGTVAFAPSAGIMQILLDNSKLSDTLCNS